MHTVLMNSGNSKTSDPHRLLHNLLYNINLKRNDKYVALSRLKIHYTWTNIKKSYKNNKFKRSAPTWNEQFELPDETYSVSDVQVYFEYIFKKHGEKSNNPSIRMNINRIENRITFNIKAGYYLELLMAKMTRLLGSTKNKITKDENGEICLIQKLWKSYQSIVIL